MSSITVILPTYNEKGNIIKLIKSIKHQLSKKKIVFEIIVVDDNSPDGTASHVSVTYKRSKQVKVFKRVAERGLASAIFFGIKKARMSYILVMDTDFNHDPKEILPMFEKAIKHDLVIGSRFINGGGMENKIREKLSLLFNVFINLLLGLKTHDNLSGFFLMKKSKLLKLPIENIFSGFGDYFMRLIYESTKQQYLIAEVPVFYKNRTYGVSKSQFLKMFLSYSYSAFRLRLTHA